MAEAGSSGCFSCRRESLLPEESFQSWANYRQALKETIPRLRNRIVTRSVESSELGEVKARSGHQMKQNLTWWDLVWFGFGAVIGAGIFVLTGFQAKEAAGPAVVLSFVVSGVSALLSVFCYTEFAVEIPVAGGSFAYLRVELGDFVAFIAAGNILLEYVISGAAVARAWTSYFATLLNHKPNDFRILVAGMAEDYNLLDPVAVVVAVLVCIFAVYSTKGSSRFNYAASIVHLAVIVFIIVAGLTKADAKNMSADFAPFGTRGIFNASAVLFFAYVGFDAVSTMAEETKNPPVDVPIGLVGSMTVTIVIYCTLAVTLCLMQPYSTIDENAPFSVAFQTVGMDWAKYVVAFGALKGMTTVLLVAAVGQARYLTHIARTHMVPPCLANVHEKTQTPMNATITMLLATAVVAFFTSLNVLSNLLSISTLFIFMLVAVALLTRRHYLPGETSAHDRNRLILFITLILVSSVATAGWWAVGKGAMGFAVTVPAWFLSTLGLHVVVPKARQPQKWGVPLVPWLPSLSIAINIFLLASIDAKSYVRFGLWTLLLLLYYLFFGLHASYDAAKSESPGPLKITC